MEPKTNLHLFDRIMAWLLSALAALTPLVVIFALVHPEVGQAYFFQCAMLLVLGALGLSWTLGWRETPRRLTFPGWLLVALGLTIAGSLWAAPVPLFSLKKLLLPLAGVAYFGLIVSHPDRARLLGRLRAVLLVMCTLLAIYGALQNFGVEFLPYRAQVEKNRVMATIGHPNYLASVLGPAVFLAVSLLSSPRGRWRKLLAWIAIFAILFCIMLARTRGVWLGLLLGLVGGLALGIHYSQRHGYGLRWLGRIGVGLALLLAVLAGGFLFARTTINKHKLEESLTSPNEVKSRVYYWRAAIDMGLQNPVFGQGYARFDPQFWTYVLEHQKSRDGVFYYDMLPAISGRTPGHVHNEYLEVLAEQGFTGLIALLAFLCFFLYYGYLAILSCPTPARAGQSIAIFGALITTMTDALFAFPWRLPVSLIILAVVLAWLYEEIYSQSATPPAIPAAEPRLTPETPTPAKA